MADPLSITASVVGITVPVLHGMRLLLDDLEKISNAPRTIESLKEAIRLNDTTVQSLQAITEPQWAALSASIVKQSKETLRDCAASCDKFRADLTSWTRHSEGGRLSWRDRAKVGFFKHDQIKSMLDQLSKYQGSMTLIVSMATFHHAIDNAQANKNIEAAILNNAVGRPETPPEPSLYIPFRRDRLFVERNDILDQLSQQLSSPGSRAALVGLGGAGKSQLAIEYAYRLYDSISQEKKNIWIFWIHAGTRARVEEGFKEIADTVKIPERNQSSANIPQLVYRWLQNERHGRWFLILDSADDISVFYDVDEKGQQNPAVSQGTKALYEYLPQTSNGSILITTRNMELGSRLIDRQTLIKVGPMKQDHALQLLEHKIGAEKDMESSAKLVKALDYMPLAISQAAAYIKRRAPRLSVEKYLQEFRANEQNQWSLLNYDNGDLRRDGSASNSVIGTWQISFDHILSVQPSAANLLSLMSFFDCQGILESLVRPADIDKNDESEDGTISQHSNSNESLESQFEKDIMTLRDYCLVSTDKDGDIFEMHGLVQLATRKWLDAHDETEGFKKQFITRIYEAFPRPDFENWGTCSKLFPHVQQAMHHRPAERGPETNESLTEWADVMYLGSWYMKDQGQYAIAEEMARDLQEINSKIRGPENPSTLNSMGVLAQIFEQLGRWKEAESLEVQVLEARKRILGPEHSDTLISMGNLALTFWNQGRWKEAESLEVQVLEARKRISGPEHPHTLISMNNLASTFKDQGRWEKAESLEVQVLEARKRILRPEHPNTLTSMSNLAYTWKSQGRDDDALKLMEQCLDARTRILGLEHPNTQSSLSRVQVWRNEKQET